MVEHFGSLSEYQQAEYWRAKRHEWVWYSKKQAEAELVKRQEDEYKRRTGSV